MTPLDFVRIDSDHDPNAPAYMFAESLDKPIQIFSGPGEEWEILSYYLHSDGRMTLDIQQKESK